VRADQMIGSRRMIAELVLVQKQQEDLRTDGPFDFSHLRQAEIKWPELFAIFVLNLLS